MDWQDTHNKLARRITLEVEFTRESYNQPFMERVREARNDLSGMLLQVACTDDPAHINDILGIERVFLAQERELLANSSLMASSLDSAIEELDAALRTIARAHSRDTYWPVEETLSLPKNRIGGLPDDEGRQFFKSHRTRLENYLKGRSTDEEKQLILRRLESLRNAEKLYIGLQRATLGVEEQAPPGDYGIPSAWAHSTDSVLLETRV